MRTCIAVRDNFLVRAVWIDRTWLSITIQWIRMLGYLSSWQECRRTIAGRCCNLGLLLWLWRFSATSSLIKWVLNYILTDFSCFLEAFYLDVQSLNVCIFGPNLHFDAFNHFFQNLDLCFNIFTALGSFMHLVLHLFLVLFLQGNYLVFQFLTFVHCVRVQHFQLLDLTRQFCYRFVRVILHFK